MERQVIEEYRWTPEGYLLTQVVLPDETFRPKLFPELEINLKALMGMEEETKSSKKRRR
jgi:hypothetical protein